jgi:hypothetical protein
MDRQTLSDTFPIQLSKQGGAKSFNFVLEYVPLGRFKQTRRKRNRMTFQHLIYVHDVNLLGNNIKNNKEALLLASKAGTCYIIHTFRRIYLIMVH